jgi:hypothetical protein
MLWPSFITFCGRAPRVSPAASSERQHQGSFKGSARGSTSALHTGTNRVDTRRRPLPAQHYAPFRRAPRSRKLTVPRLMEMLPKMLMMHPTHHAMAATYQTHDGGSVKSRFLGVERMSQGWSRALDGRRTVGV